MEPSLLDIRSFEDQRARVALDAFIVLYEEAFPDPDLKEDPAIWEDRLACGPALPEPKLFILVELGEGAEQAPVRGGIVFEYYRESRCGLLAYLVVHPDHRRQGVARRLVQEAIRLLQEEAKGSGASLNAVFAETEHFNLEAGDDRLAEDERRLAALAGLGAKWIDIPYVQPPLGPDKQPVDNLWFLIFPLGPEQALSIPREHVLAYLDEFYRALGQTEVEAHPDFQAMARRLRASSDAYGEDRVPYHELPVLEQPGLQFTKLAVSVHVVTVEIDRQLLSSEPMAAASSKRGYVARQLRRLRPALRQHYDAPRTLEHVGITLIDGDPQYFCPYFHSFETDILSYRFQEAPPLDSVCMQEAPRLITIHFPERIQYLTEGRRMTLYGRQRDVQAHVNLTYTRFEETNMRVWHLTFSPPPGAGFSEYEAIKLINLYENYQEQTHLIDAVTFSIDGHARLSFNALLHHLSEGQVLAMQPQAGTVAVDPDDETTREKLAWRDIFTDLHEIRKDNVVTAQELEQAYEQVGTSRYIKACCGLVEGIFDFERMGIDELIDTLTPNIPVIPEVLLIRKGTLTSFNVGDDMFSNEVCRSTIGISPYLIIPHAVMLHNEFLVDCAEEMLDSTAQTRNIRTLERAKETVERYLKRYYIPNVFQYPTERGIYDVGHQHRGSDEKKAVIADKTAELQSRLQAELDLLGERRGFYMTVVLGLLSATAVLEALQFFYRDNGTAMLGLWPPNVPFMILSAFLLLVVWVFAIAYPRRR